MATGIGLALDTSTSLASIALFRAGHPLAEMSWQAGQNHTAELMPKILHLLQDSGAKPSDLSAVVVARGPGSFNGVRVGVSTAKGLALALDIPLVGISTLEMEAYQHADSSLPICPLLKAGRGELATALFQWRKGLWSRLWEETLLTPEELCLRTHRRTLFCGEITPEVSLFLGEHLGLRAVFPLRAASLRRAGFLAELGWRRLEQGERDDVALLQPLYLRSLQITTKYGAKREEGYA